MKKFTLFAYAAFLALFILSGLVLLADDTTDGFNTDILHVETGIITSHLTPTLITETGDITIHALLPQTDNNRINLPLLAHVTAEIAAFKAAVDAGDLLVSFTYHVFSPNLISITILSSGTSADHIHRHESAKGFVFELDSGYQLGLDALVPNAAEALAAQGITLPYDYSFAVDSHYLWIFDGISAVGAAFLDELTLVVKTDEAAPVLVITECMACDALFPKSASLPPFPSNVLHNNNLNHNHPTVTLPGRSQNVGQADAPTTAPRYVALTFDDGPSRRHTTQILDLLEEYGAQATFFILGSRVAGNEDIVRRMFRDGHAVGNHSFNHRQLNAIAANQMEWQVLETNRIIEELLGAQVRLFRPPFMETNVRVNEFVSTLEMSVIFWDIDPRDWYLTCAQAIADHVISRAQDGSIILLHDMYNHTVDATRIILQTLTERGFVFVTACELIEQQFELEPGLIYRNGRTAGRR